MTYTDQAAPRRTETKRDRSHDGHKGARLRAGCSSRDEDAPSYDRRSRRGERKAEHRTDRRNAKAAILSARGDA